MKLPSAGDARLREVCQAMSDLAHSTKGLSALPLADRKIPQSCAVLLVAEKNGAEVRMDIFVIGARVVAQSGIASADVGTAQIEDHLTVDLSQGYNWNDATFASPAEMAFILLKHMKRRLLAAADMHSHSSD
ncbi:MAG TPA: hypothetical protein VGC44_14560 [Longimicrobiales bacterium]